MPLETVNFFGKHGEKQDGGDKFVPTQDELRTIQDKMRDPKFMELFGEYMKSMEDPEARREEEEYLAQVEREAKEGGDYSFEFVFPRPGFVVELLEPSTSYIPQHPAMSSNEDKKKKENADNAEGKSSEKKSKKSHSFRVFVNMCSSEKVDPFREESVGNSRDSNWHVPVAISKPRTELFNDDEEKSKEGAVPVVVYDAVFHPKTLQLADQSDRFCCFLVNIAVEHINTGYGDRNGFEFRRLGSRIASVGTPQNQTIRKKNGISPFAPAMNEPVLRGPTKTLPTSSDDKASVRAAPTKKIEKKSENENKIENMPRCTIVHRGHIDLADTWGWKVVDQRIGVPEELVVRMELSGLNTAADLSVDVEDEYVRIARSEKHPFHGALTLPFSVEPTPVEAKFERKKAILTLVLRVVPPAPTGITAADMRQKLTSPAEPNAGTDTDDTRNEETKEAETHTDHNANEKDENATIKSSAPAAVPDASTSPKVEKDAQSLSAPTPVSPAPQCGAAVPQDKQTGPARTEPAPEVSCIGDQDRVRVMMEKVQQARRERERAAAAAAAADTAAAVLSNANGETNAIAETNAVGETSAIDENNAIGETNAIDENNAIGETNAIDENNAVGETNAIDENNAVGETNAIDENNAVGETNAIDENNAIGETNAIDENNAIGETNAIDENNAIGETNAIDENNAVGETNAIDENNAVGETNAIDENNAIGETSAIGESGAIRDPAAAEEAADLQRRQAAWLSDVQQRAEAREAVERDAALQAERDAEKETRREAERVRRRTEAMKKQEAAEAKLRERMVELPLCNKHIFAID